MIKTKMVPMILMIPMMIMMAHPTMGMLLVLKLILLVITTLTLTTPAMIIVAQPLTLPRLILILMAPAMRVSNELPKKVIYCVAHPRPLLAAYHHKYASVGPSVGALYLNLFWKFPNFIVQSR